MATSVESGISGSLWSSGGHDLEIGTRQPNGPKLEAGMVGQYITLLSISVRLPFSSGIGRSHNGEANRAQPTFYAEFK
jgi:hypothetical protein